MIATAHAQNEMADYAALVRSRVRSGDWWVFVAIGRKARWTYKEAVSLHYAGDKRTGYDRRVFNMVNAAGKKVTVNMVFLLKRHMPLLDLLPILARHCPQSAELLKLSTAVNPIIILDGGDSPDARDTVRAFEAFCHQAGLR